MGAPAKRVELTPEDLATLLLWEASGKTEQRPEVAPFVWTGWRRS